jgi:hypothetical protein
MAKKLLLICFILLLSFGAINVLAASVSIDASIPAEDGGPVFPPPPPPGGDIFGCTDSSANNYNPSATVDNGTCTYDVYGCTDPTAINYNASANIDDGTCIAAVLGCTDPVAINYNSSANQDDGSCTYSDSGCTDPAANNYNPVATIDDGSCTYESIGCTNPAADNYNPSATEDDGSCIISGCTNINADNYNSTATIDNGTCIISGCTDPISDNYDPDANNDNGTCIISGCTDILADNYDPTATSNDGSCVISGCTNPLAQNYMPIATVDDGSCMVLGCTDPVAVNYNPDATIDNDSCSYDETLIPGCTDASALNYNPEATIDNGSCTYPISGCTDVNALNYNSVAVLDNGSCVYPLPPVPPGGGPGSDRGYAFYTNNNGLNLTFSGLRRDTINLLLGHELVVLTSDKEHDKISDIYVDINSQRFSFSHDLSASRYVLSLDGFNAVGKTDASFVVSYRDGSVDQTDIVIETHRLGSVFSHVPTEESRIFGISVFLYDENDNPVISLNRINDDGTYGFMVENSRYKLVVFDNGTEIYNGRLFSVKNNIINKNIGLSLWEQIIETATEILGEVGDLALGVGGLVNDEVLNNPAVEKANQYAAPAVVTVASVTTIVSIPWWSLVHYLQYFFTEPLAWLFRRRKKGWGVIYNSITKQPVDLAVVRLYDKKTGKLLKSKVTDSQGRYSFLVSEGEYSLEVIKPDMSFPSTFLMETDDDHQFTDLYHGETININQNQKGVITANIPVDAKDAEISDAVVIRRHLRDRIKKNIHFVGPIFAIISLAISPSAIIVLFTVIHLLLFLIFNRLALVQKTTKWGMVIDATTGEPISGSVAKIYSPEYNKMLESQVTDSHGRYGFLVGNNIYYITASKGGYNTSKTENIDLTRKKSDEVIGKDIKLSVSSGESIVEDVIAEPASQDSSDLVQASSGQSSSQDQPNKEDSDLREMAKKLNSEASDQAKKQDKKALNRDKSVDTDLDDKENHETFNESKFG